MEKSSRLYLSFLPIFLLALASTAGAETRKKGAHKASSASTETQAFSASEPSYSSSSSKTPLSVGFTTGPGTGLGPLGSTAIAGIIGLQNGDMIQAMFGIPTTQGNFNFGLGGIYKHNISEHHGAAFHAGGGFALGSVTGNFAFSIAAVGGFHFNLPSVSAIQLHLDGGPSFTIISSDPSTSSFQISALSPVMGLTAVYAF